MPIYEYRCSQCGHELEALRKFSDPPLLACPACHADALVKKVSAAGFQLKGSGWYATDFRNGSKPAAPAKSDDKAGGSAATAGAKGDAAGSSGDAAQSGKSDAAPAADKPAKPAAAKSEPAPAKTPSAPSTGSSTS